MVSSFAARGWAASVGSCAKSAVDRGARGIVSYYGYPLPSPNRTEAATGRGRAAKIAGRYDAGWLLKALETAARER